MRDLSVIIISYKTPQLTLQTVKTAHESIIKNSKLDAEIIVFDNNSKDSTVKEINAYAKSCSTDILVMESDKNYGFGVGNNKAVEYAQGETLLFLNSDIIVLDDAIPEMYRTFRRESFHIAGAKLLNEDKSPQLSACKFQTIPVAFSALFLRGDQRHKTRTSPSTISQVDWVSGACFMMKKDIYDKLGGFSEDIFMYFEETDLMYRAHLAGYTVGFFPDPTFIHLEGASSSSRTGPILKIYEGYILFYKKHFSKTSLAILRIMLQLKALIALGIGYLTSNAYLINTYTKAYEISKKA